MKNRNVFVSVAATILVLNLVVAPTASAAVKLEVPKSIMDLWQKIKLQQAQADDTGGTLSAPLAPSTPPPGDNNNNFQNPPPPGTTDQAPKPEQFNSQPMMGGQNPNPQSFPDPNRLDPNNRGQFYPDPDHQNTAPKPADDQKNLRTFQNGANQMNGMLNNFQKQMQRVQKNGSLPPQMQGKMEEAKGLINKMKNADSTGDIGEGTVDQLQGLMGELQQSGDQAVEDTRRLSGVKKEMGNMERNISSFRKQLDKLSKQGIAAPSDVTEKLTQIKTVLDAVKNAQSMDEVQSAGLEDIGDLMSDLNDSRQQLEMLSRWPQTSKQIDKELKNFERSLSRDKKLVEKLSKQGVDLNDTYQKISDAHSQLKSVRDQAAEKIKSGDAQSAYDLLENDFFDKTDDLREQQSVFDTLSNLGRFNSDFKRETTNAKKIIAKLSKQGEDVSELNNQLSEINQKGADLVNALKEKPIDIESVSGQLEDLSDLRQEFQNSIQELMPDDSPKPWEQGKDQFQNLKLSPNFNKLLSPNSNNQQ